MYSQFESSPYADTFLFLSFDSSYYGLVSFWLGRETNDERWVARATESKVSIEKLAVLASTWNFQNSECDSTYATHS